jgi:hypothetical protein
MDMSAVSLYSGWRSTPAHLRQLQSRYMREPTKRGLRDLMQRDTMMYHGILQMIQDRIKRISNLKSEKLIEDNCDVMGVVRIKAGINKHGFAFNIYRGNTETKDILNKRDMMLHFQVEFIRTGRVTNITHLRKLDKELVVEIKEFLKKEKSI